jgi:hypothetical protein
LLWHVGGRIFNHIMGPVNILKGMIAAYPLKLTWANAKQGLKTSGMDFLALVLDAGSPLLGLIGGQFCHEVMSMDTAGA